MRIWLKPERMAALNISPFQVRQALAANNYLTAVGQTKGSLIQVNLTANSDLRSVEEFKRLVIREQEGIIVRLEDISQDPNRPEAEREYLRRLLERFGGS